MSARLDQPDDAPTPSSDCPEKMRTDSHGVGELRGSVFELPGHRPDAADREVEALLEAAAKPTALAPVVGAQDAPDAAETLGRLDRVEQAQVVHEMDNVAAAEALAQMDPPLALTVLLDIDPAEAAELLRLMEPDDAADVLQHLPRALCAELLGRLPAREAAHLGKLVLYDPESAGGIMTTEVLVVRAQQSVGAGDRTDQTPICQRGSARGVLRRRPEAPGGGHQLCDVDADG